jgi:hypothetical protein
MIEGAEPHCLNGVFGSRERGQHDHRRRVIPFPDAPQNLYAVHAARHSQIEQYAVDIVPYESRQSLATGRGDARCMSKIGDGLSEPFAQGNVRSRNVLFTLISLGF